MLRVPTEQAVNRDRYVELPQTTNEGSNTKPEDMDTYTSNAFGEPIIIYCTTVKVHDNIVGITCTWYTYTNYYYSYVW